MADEAPVVGVAAMGCMTTAELVTADVAPDVRSRWEHEGLLSVIDAASGRLVVGAKGRSADEITDLVGSSLAQKPRRSLAWVTAVGSDLGLREAFGDDGSCLAGIGIDAFWHESTPARRTWVIPNEARERAVPELHRRLVRWQSATLGGGATSGAAAGRRTSAPPESAGMEGPE